MPVNRKGKDTVHKVLVRVFRAVNRGKRHVAAVAVVDLAAVRDDGHPSAAVMEGRRDRRERQLRRGKAAAEPVVAPALGRGRDPW